MSKRPNGQTKYVTDDSPAINIYCAAQQKLIYISVTKEKLKIFDQLRIWYSLLWDLNTK